MKPSPKMGHPDLWRVGVRARVLAPAEVGQASRAGVWLRDPVEGVEELLLGCCDGLGVERGDLGGGLGLLDGALGLGGKDSAIAGGVGVTLSDGGCDAAGAGWGGGRGRECERGLRGSAAAAAVCGEAVCDLAAEGLGGGGRRGGAGRGGAAAEGESLDASAKAGAGGSVSSSAEPILLKTQTHFREIV